MERYYLGFDAGTQSVKVEICNEQMECVASATKPTTLYYPKPGWVEMDLDEYFESTKTCIRLCVTQMAEKHLDVRQIKSIMGDGIICGIAGVDREGNVITPYINYLDSRTEKDVQYINQKNLDLWGRETGNAKANCMFPAMFARWILKYNKDFRKKGVKFVHNAPYILSRLAGLSGEEMFIDWGTMSGWGLGYLVYEKKWSEKQLEILGIDLSYMPKIVKPWTIIGNLTKDVAEEIGLVEGIPICAGAGDTMQSMLGSGIVKAGQAVDVAGTCAMFCVSTNGIIEELTNEGSDLIFNSGTLKDSYFYWGYIRTGGLALRWFKDNICQREKEDDYYQTISQKASKIPPGSNGVLFLPYLTGGIGEQSNASGCFLNLNLDTDQAVLWRSVLEGIGYDYMEIIKQYGSAGANISRIAVTEGGSKNDLWNQIKADMLNTDVVTFANAGGAVRMNCLFGAFAVGDIDDIDQKLEDYLKIKKIYPSDADSAKKYQKKYAIQRKLVRKDMKEVFASLQEIRK